MAKKMILAGMLSLAGTALLIALFLKTACGLLLPLVITFEPPTISSCGCWSGYRFRL